MMGRSPRCYIPSFVKIGPPVLEKIFEGGFTIYGHGGHLGHVTRIMLTNFHFLVQSNLYKSATFGSGLNWLLYTGVCLIKVESEMSF